MKKKDEMSLKYTCEDGNATAATQVDDLGVRDLGIARVNTASIESIHKVSRHHAHLNAQEGVKDC